MTSIHCKQENTHQWELVSVTSSKKRKERLGGVCCIIQEAISEIVFLDFFRFWCHLRSQIQDVSLRKTTYITILNRNARMLCINDHGTVNCCNWGISF